METLRNLFAQLKGWLDFPLLRLGETQLTLWLLLYLTVLVALLFYVTGKLKTWVADRLLARTQLEAGVRQATGSILRYLVIVIGFLIILQTAGIDLTTLNIIAGAVGIGVGFGLQNIVSNFISGLIILFERPIKLGDRIEVGAVEGDVVAISARSTTVVTNDNIAIIVPNSKFISENVVNWSYTDRKVRFRIPVSVAYGSDFRLVEKLLLEVARENPDVLDEPEPGVRFLKFGDNGLEVELRAWTTKLLHRRGRLVSALNQAIYEKFEMRGIECPFPQRDIHLHLPRASEELLRLFLNENRLPQKAAETIEEK
jgi:small-conductance mechanosensitive channel